MPTMTPADREAFERVTRCNPRWLGVASARDAIGLADRILLHAGPALIDSTRPPAPMLNAGVLACLHEGWATTAADAERQISAGLVRLQPGSTYRVSTPLVSMVSARTTLAIIEDAANRSRWFGFLGTGGGAQMRFGGRDPAILDRLRFREAVLAPGFAELLSAGAVDLLALARSGLTEGDDLHNRLSSATAMLQAVLATRKIDSETARAALAMIGEAPLYFLNLWMPACALALDQAVGVLGSSMVTRLSANGEACAIEIAGAPGQTFSAPASLVCGPFMKGAPENPQFPPATGDSGIIDAFGLGGQVLRRAPSLLVAFEPWLTTDDAARAQSMLMSMHPVLGVECGLSAKAIVASGRTPLLSTGMVSADGRGLLGRGLCQMPLALFEQAMARLHDPSAN